MGDFYRLGGATGSGASQVDPEDKIVVRNDDPGNAHGRYDVEGGGNWLDSNAHAGIRWEIPGQSGLSDILRIAFFLTDVDDVGSFGFRFEVSEDEIDTVNVMGKPNNNRDDAELQLVTMLFDKPVSLLSIEMTAGTNDGFGLDGIQVAAVLLPASAQPETRLILCLIGPLDPKPSNGRALRGRFLGPRPRIRPGQPDRAGRDKPGHGQKGSGPDDSPHLQRPRTPPPEHCFPCQNGFRSWRVKAVQQRQSRRLRVVNSHIAWPIVATPPSSPWVKLPPQ